MDNIVIHKYYRSYGYSISSLLYRFLIADNDLRTYFHLNLYYGILTTLLCLFAVVVITCSIAYSSAADGDEKIFYDTQKETRKILPRRESILDIRPAYTCIRKHLKQTEIFQEKCDKTAQSQWRRSRSPKVFCRIVNPVTSSA
ncbi:uncharacterized protein LOC107270616 isoform X2 [Cephus cinctus]|uniref:Uncharacterized protein LOC107270616 isoform X2 n=1 Tax=Cephus cinctus TaxID=211228 RepID=A0AAJ7RMP6_CEPCN|nr:uncharacterized protein LOC107270616 isoform X2 [Cephus cinctus]